MRYFSNIVQLSTCFILFHCICQLHFFTLCVTAVFNKLTYLICSGTVKLYVITGHCS